MGDVIEFPLNTRGAPEEGLLGAIKDIADSHAGQNAELHAYICMECRKIMDLVPIPKADGSTTLSLELPGTLSSGELAQIRKSVADGMEEVVRAQVQPLVQEVLHSFFCAMGAAFGVRAQMCVDEWYGSGKK